MSIAITSSKKPQPPGRPGPGISSRIVEVLVRLSVSILNSISYLWLIFFGSGNFGPLKNSSIRITVKILLYRSVGTDSTNIQDHRLTSTACLSKYPRTRTHPTFLKYDTFTRSRQRNSASVVCRGYVSHETGYRGQWETQDDEGRVVAEAEERNFCGRDAMEGHPNPRTIDICIAKSQSHFRATKHNKSHESKVGLLFNVFFFSVSQLQFDRSDNGSMNVTSFRSEWEHVARWIELGWEGLVDLETRAAAREVGSDDSEEEEEDEDDSSQPLPSALSAAGILRECRHCFCSVGRELPSAGFLACAAIYTQNTGFAADDIRYDGNLPNAD
ncbi:hypothetical protein R3P38DRAFT_2816053 [Favolaschia claudopus]|uniref:Uncharacterized protein n=1 Tax=Favolaschia claudopus TaxID=2862362 RepID=A0AAV9YZP8_9AGAR